MNDILPDYDPEGNATLSSSYLGDETIDQVADEEKSLAEPTESFDGYTEIGQETTTEEPVQYGLSKPRREIIKAKII